MKQLGIHKRLITVLLLFIGAFSSLLSCAYKAQEVGGISRHYDKDKPAALYKKEHRAELKTKRSSRDDADEYAPEREKEGDITGKVKDRLVIYVAKFSLMVRSVRRSMDEINNIVSRFNGFIESTITSDSYRYAKVVVRVPVKNFEDAIKSFEKIGTVTDKSVTASDVTMEYNDVVLRLETAKRVRQRMYELLKRVKKVKERVKILREIERLTTIIDSLTSRMNYLKNRASYSTIVLELRAMVKDVVKRYIPSPFPWIAKLDPYRRTIFDDGEGIQFNKPEGFFHLDKEFYSGKSTFLFVTPDQSTGIRIGFVENYPPADLEFWSEAFKIDLQNRMYKIISEDELQGRMKMHYKRFSVKLSSGGIYIVAFAVHGEKIVVIEATFPDEKNYSQKSTIIEEFIKSIGLK
jgi:hypothetical protein